MFMAMDRFSSMKRLFAAFEYYYAYFVGALSVYFIFGGIKAPTEIGCHS